MRGLIALYVTYGNGRSMACLRRRAGDVARSAEPFASFR